MHSDDNEYETHTRSMSTNVASFSYMMHFIVHSFIYYHGASYNATQNNKNHVKATKEQNDGWYDVHNIRTHTIVWDANLQLSIMIVWQLKNDTINYTSVTISHFLKIFLYRKMS